MSKPPFEPRGSCQVPSTFGKFDTVMWNKPGTLVEHQQFQAAYMQHAYCLAIRKHAYEKFGSVKNYAAKAEQRYDRLARVLRGQAPLRLEDIGVARVLLGNIHESARVAMAHEPLFGSTWQ